MVILIIDMSKHQTSADSIIRWHASVVSQSNNLTSKVMYSINCLQNAIEYHNNNREANLKHLQPLISKILKLAQLSGKIPEDYLYSLLKFFNSLVAQRASLTKQESMALVSMILSVEVASDTIGQQLVGEIAAATSKTSERGQNFHVLLFKMSANQIIRLINSFRQNCNSTITLEFSSLPMSHLISLATHHPKNLQIISKVLQSIHWQLINPSSVQASSNQTSQIINFIHFALANNPADVRISSLGALVYRQIVDNVKSLDKKTLNKDFDVFMRQNGLVGIQHAYIQGANKLVRSFQDIRPVLESEIDPEFNSQLRYLLRYYIGSEFTWRQELLSSVKNGKGAIAKELLLRIGERWDSGRQSKNISEKEEINLSNSVPIQCLRTLAGILSKLSKDPTPHNALYTLGIFHNLPQNGSCLHELLLQLLEIRLKNRQFASLQQIQKIICDQIPSELVASKVREKGSVKRIDSNWQGRRYFICVPLVCSKTQAQTLSDTLTEIFGHETVPLTLKIHLAEFVFNKMILTPSKAFMAYVLRISQNNLTDSALQLILHCLRPYSLNQNPAVAEWYSKNFSQATQKLVQLLFSRLVTPQLTKVTKLLFLLEKFNLYGTSWLNHYRWVLNSLEDFSVSQANHTTDCLEILQMLIEKIPPGNIPANVVQRFQKIILKNWGKFNQDHLYALERIYGILNQHSHLAFAESTMPSLDVIMNQNEKAPEKIANYIRTITFNYFFGHIESQTAFKSLVELYNNLKGQREELITEEIITPTFNLLLYLFEGSQQPVDSKFDDLTATLISKRQNFSIPVKQKCLQYLTRIPHNFNILKLPLVQLAKQGFYQYSWLEQIIQLLNIVSDSKPKALGSFKLQEILRSIFIALIGCQNPTQADVYMSFLEATCFIEGDYESILEQCLPALENVLKSERYGVWYRKQLVQFALGALLDYEYTLSPTLLWFIMSKYASESEIILLILEYFEKYPIQNNVLEDKLLMRVVAIHTDDDQIQQKCKQQFKLYAPKSSVQQQLAQNFSSSNFEKCQSIIDQVRNPYSVNFSLSEIRSLLQWNNTAQSCKKLLRFIHGNPQHQQKIYSCSAFILNPQYLSYLCEVVEKASGDSTIDRFQKLKKPALKLKRNPILDVLQSNILQIIQDKKKSLELKNLMMESFKNHSDHFSVLLKMIVLIFSKLSKENKTNDKLKVFSSFWQGVCGQLQLKDKQNANRFIVKDLIFIFPYFLSSADINNSQSPSSLLKHYKAVLSSYSAIIKEIGCNRYFISILKAILLKSQIIQNKGSFTEDYLKVYYQLQGNEQLVIKAEDKQKTKQILISILNFVNKFAQIKVREANKEFDPIFVSSYISHLLFLINQGFQLDVSTLQIVKGINSNIESLNLLPPQKEVITEAVAWVIKQIEKYVGSVKFQHKIQKKSSQDNQYRQIKANQQLTKFAQPVQSPSNSSPKEQKVQEKANHRKPEVKEQIPEHPMIRIKQTEQITTIRESHITNKTTYVILNNPTSTEQLFNEQIQKPKQQTFNEEKFYKQQSLSQQQLLSQAERLQNLQKVKNITAGQTSNKSLKDHCKFISTIADFNKITPQEYNQLLLSIESISQTASSHPFYVRKVNQFQASTKLIRIYKMLWKNGEKSNCQTLLLSILQLFLGMSKIRQKKLIIFADQQTVQFFKMIAKRRLNSHGQQKQIQLLLQILFNCKNNTEIYFNLGLLSMLIEIINRDKESIIASVLEYLIKIDLTAYIINEIYQRGLFNKLVQAFSLEMSSQFSRHLLCLWIKLAGKVCINQSIQAKFCSKQLQKLVWAKISFLKTSVERKAIAYFFSYLCVKNDAVTEWMIQSKVLEQLLASLGEQNDNQDLYLLFYHFCFTNISNRDYCFRIKYHIHLLARLNSKWLQTKEDQESALMSKYFYKSLGQLMSSRVYVSTFLKEQVVKKLIDIYQAKFDPFIFECLLQFISALQTDGEFDELKNQKFWQTLKIFEYKMSSEASYSYLIQMFLIMIKKGRSKEFSYPQLRNKVCLKAQFSINMQGKQLALRFILALSIKDKQNYITQKGVSILSSILGLKVTKNQLQLTQDLLKLEGVTKSDEIMKLFIQVNNIPSLIIQHFEKMNEEELKLACNIILILINNHSFTKQVGSACLPNLKKVQEKVSGQIFGQILNIFSILSANPENKEVFQFLQIEKLVKTESYINKAKENDCLSHLTTLQKNLKIKAAGKAGKYTRQQMQTAVKSIRQGRKVRMYKTDGSISELIIFISCDCLEINCAVALIEVVKQKWRLPINQVTSVIQYDSQDSTQFKNSYFQKNSGFFSKAPNSEQCLSLIGKSNEFHICFWNKGDKETWKEYFLMAKEYCTNLLAKIGSK